MAGPDGAMAFVDSLVADGRLDAAALSRAAGAASASGQRIDRVLRPLGLVSDEAWFASALRFTGLPALDPATDLDADDVRALAVVPLSFQVHNRCLVWRTRDGATRVAVEDPFDAVVRSAVRIRVDGPVERFLMPPGMVDRLMPDLFPDLSDAGSEGAGGLPTAGPDDDVATLRDLASNAPVIRLVDAVVRDAVERGASDVHLTADRAGNSRIRFRVDGVLAAHPSPPPGLHAAIVSRIKIVAGLDIGERRLPQDGRARLGVGGRPVDVRISTMPHVRGEGVVLRILDRGGVRLDFDALGLSGPVLDGLMAALDQRNGLLLVTGPTGSGKSTTLYTALRHLMTGDRNIVTIEDPVEIELDGVSQIEVARQAGLDFAGALRSVLRQDPDVVMIGEIRDGETARIAVQAALTGHLVLATLHTNSAAGAAPRLADMGVEPFLIASTLRGVLSQRLVRRTCASCRGTGCAACGDSGYRGRIAAAEFLCTSGDVSGLIARGAGEAELAACIGTSLAADARAKVDAGLTDTGELRRVLGSS